MTLFNPNQLATLTEAKALQAALARTYGLKAYTPDEGYATEAAPGIAVPIYGGPYNSDQPGVPQFYSFFWARTIPPVKDSGDEPTIHKLEQNVGLVRTLIAQYGGRIDNRNLFDDYFIAGLVG